MSNYSSSLFDKNNQNTSWYKAFDLIKEKTKVLDIGCSSGNFGKVLIDEKGCIVDGVELDRGDWQKAKNILRKVYNINVETDDLSIIKDKYDYVYFGDVIEHLVSPVKTLKRVGILLNKSGSIVFSIPNMGYIAIRLELLLGEFEYTETGLLDKTHLHYYTQKEVLRVFEEAGYKIDLLDYVKSGYTKRYIDTFLSKAGLKATDKFHRFCQTPEASAFQFVGSASFSDFKKITKSKLKQYGPVERQGDYYENLLKQKDKLNKENQKLIDSLHTENQKLSKAYSEIINSKRYKLADRLGNMFSKSAKHHK